MVAEAALHAKMDSHLPWQTAVGHATTRNSHTRRCQARWRPSVASVSLGQPCVGRHLKRRDKGSLQPKAKMAMVLVASRGGSGEGRKEKGGWRGWPAVEPLWRWRRVKGGTGGMASDRTVAGWEEGEGSMDGDAMEGKGRAERRGIMGKKAAIDTDSAMASLSLDDMKAVRERLCMALIFWQLVLPLLWLTLPWILPRTDFILRRRPASRDL